MARLPRLKGRTAPAVLAALAGSMVILAGCAGPADGGGDTATATSEPASAQVEGALVVLAAASLTETFTELGRIFEAEHPKAKVTFSFAASSELATQVEQGAPADVFASASPATMAVVTDAGLAAATPVTFVRNTLQIVTPAGNPAGVSGLADFTKKSLVVALCAPEVPCGAAAEQVFTAAGVTPAPDTLEADVRATLAKVRLGEVDAALVYRTDVLAAGDEVEGIEFPEAAGAVNDYPIAALTDAPNPVAASAFVDLVRSPEGARVFVSAGFDVP